MSRARELGAIYSSLFHGVKHMRNKQWYYKKIIKEEQLKEKWQKNVPVTKEDIIEMIYIDRIVRVK